MTGDKKKYGHEKIIW